MKHDKSDMGGATYWADTLYTVRENIRNLYGPQCPDFNKKCDTCKAWRIYFKFEKKMAKLND
jgi:hypothetical protein